jgi:nitrogen fixation NifU-like protein
VSFVGDGCAISQASASMLSQELHGKSLAAVKEMDRDDIVDLLGVEISPMRIKCAVLAEKVAQDGIAIHEGEIDETTTE